MHSTTNQSKMPGFSRAPRPSSFIGKRVLSTVQTSGLERFLVMGVVALVPIEASLPTLGGLSATFIVFIFFFGYLVLCRLGVLLRTAQCPVFVAGYIFLATALVMEIWHGSPEFKALLRLFMMILGAICVASVCRDRSALHSCMSGYVLGSLMLAPILILTLYGVLSAANVTDFQEASVLRIGVEHKTGLKTNLNTMATSLAQGTLVALVLAIFAKTFFKKIGFLGLSFVFGLATFLPMSRSGVLILLVSIAPILYVYGALNPKVIILVLVLSVGLLAVVPNAALTRLTISTEQQSRGGYEDSRTELYTTAIRALPEYFLTGVGMSALVGKWGRRYEMLQGGAHNCTLQVSILWGLPGLISFLALIWQAYRCLPKRYGADPLRLCILGLAVSALGSTFFSHNFESKEFSLILGILAGADLRIWPRLSGQPRRGRGQGSSPDKLSLGSSAKTMHKRGNKTGLTR